MQRAWLVAASSSCSSPRRRPPPTRGCPRSSPTTWCCSSRCRSASGAGPRRRARRGPPARPARRRPPPIATAAGASRWRRRRRAGPTSSSSPARRRRRALHRRAHRRGVGRLGPVEHAVGGAAGRRTPTRRSRRANHPRIRLFSVQARHRARAEGRRHADGRRADWAVATPASIPHFSAVGYFFARDAAAGARNVPIGFIHSSWGGTPAEAWTRARRARATIRRCSRCLAQYRRIEGRVPVGSATATTGASRSGTDALKAWQAANPTTPPMPAMPRAARRARGSASAGVAVERDDRAAHAVRDPRRASGTRARPTPCAPGTTSA